MRTEVAAILFTLAAVLICIEVCAGATFSFRLIHRFSDEAGSVWAAKGRQGPWPERDSVERARLLLSSDFKHQRLRLGSQKQLLVPSEGSQTFDYGNDWSWLHYAWIDIGTPNVSFLVALDTGSDLLWVPCDCVQCAPLSSSYYTVLDRDLNEYSPARSSTSKQLPCSHQLCDLGPDCKSPKEHCPYMVDYLSENTSSSGFLFEDQLHLILSGEHSHQDSALAPIIIGCGSKQSGSYLDGAAPDGVLGLGPGKISVPSLLANSGLVPHSFSLCFDKSHSGRIFFGDQGPGNQRFTPFLPLEGNYNKYIVEVEHYCVESSCLKQSGFRAQVDSGSSFTLLPYETYKKVVNKFDELMNATRSSVDVFHYCYKARSQGLPNIPSMKLILSANQSFVIQNPMFPILNYQGVQYYCLGVLPIEGMYGLIGQNFMTGYRMVFDWEKLKLGWSASNCKDLDDNDKVPVTPTPSGLSASPLPTNEQQRTPNGHAVAPALAGRAPPRPSAASPCTIHCQHCTLILLMLLQSFVWLCYLV
ncbi:aspartic proteinase-like protein 1 [Ipomoea triloba]|uniref:aspartic proteinase-like protein 1 n=1 Tax=Ipomoea triloba TaxID=35885 RepID=UPI00125E06F7|nr:aspartic proteinase-like protein 1 [Ipomoea triloba]